MRGRSGVIQIVVIERECPHLGLGDDDAGLVTALIQLRLRGAPSRSAWADQFDERFKKVTRARPREFSVRWQKSRCSILFHLLVPGGKCET